LLFLNLLIKKNMSSYNTGNNLVDSNFLLEKAGVHEGMHIADFGCGRTGHMVFSAARVVSDKGLVYAVDILKDVLEAVRRRALTETLHNIETIWGDIATPHGVSISDKSLDAVFLVNVLFHFENYEEVLFEAARLLKSKGRIVIADWQNHLEGIGPMEEKMIDFDKIISWAKQNNFSVQEDTNIGNYHRALLLYRNV